MPSWIGTSKAQHRRTGSESRQQQPRWPRQPAMYLFASCAFRDLIDLLRRDESSLNSLGRDAKGGIKKFLEPVGRLASELVRLCVGHERSPGNESAAVWR